MKNELHIISPYPAHNIQMNSFIITTNDGKIIVVDGGHRADAEKLLNKLRELSGNTRPHVDAWLLSHIHLDHVDAFLELLEHYDSCFTCGALYYNFPPMPFVEKYETREYHTYKEFAALSDKYSSYAHTVSVGDTYQIGDARLDILFTPDTDITFNAVNNSSVVFRLTLGEKTVMFLGDAGVEAGNELLMRYGNSLKSDICQMAHHGQSGVSREVYAAVAPKECIWCTPDWLWDNDMGKGFDTHTFRTVEVRGWMRELGVKKHWVTKDGDAVIAM